jgi:hypothetical protein
VVGKIRRWRNSKYKIKLIRCPTAGMMKRSLPSGPSCLFGVGVVRRTGKFRKAAYLGTVYVHVHLSGWVKQIDPGIGLDGSHSALS